ncbi:hypothetical protein TNIN_8741 [Trichonephila inaurata madagascariensis]|uniref:Uncharacterized protein n=1 Tax=Trichonephila inaurata madagascariensis TaxID=2747483 RepID=A0A8X6JBT7_9ARAC|nr:hypothetical protein TNIN_8741 [Trichonephila inaurata madagascariensis]
MFRGKQSKTNTNRGAKLPSPFYSGGAVVLNIFPPPAEERLDESQSDVIQNSGKVLLTPNDTDELYGRIREAQIRTLQRDTSL